MCTKGLGYENARYHSHLASTREAEDRSHRNETDIPEQHIINSTPEHATMTKVLPVKYTIKAV